METKKFLLASAAASGILAVGGLAWYGLLRNFYKSQSPRQLRRYRPSLTVDALARAVYGVGLAATYPRSRSNANSPVGRGFRTGILTGALASMPSSLSEWGGRRTSLPATVATVAFETVLGGIAGAAVGKIYGDFPHITDIDIESYSAFDREPAEGPVEEEAPAAPRRQHNGRMSRSRR